MTSFQAAPSFPFDLTLPTLTVATLLEAQHKNAAALANANQAVFDGLKSFVHRQGFLFTASVDTYTRVTGDLTSAESFEERAAKQADAARDAYVSIVARFRELSDIVIEANATAMSIVSARIIEALGEWKALFAPPAAATATTTSEAAASATAAPVAAPEEIPVIERASVAADPAPAIVPAAPTIAPEVAAPEEEATAVATTSAPEIVAPEPDVAAAPVSSPKTTPPTTKPAVAAARTTVPKATPSRPPRRPTSRG
ncbi:MAG: phasin family protein [Reyranellaceae bacterium]